MAQSIKNRVFGSDVPSQIKDKIELRQKLAKSSNFGELIDPGDKAYNFDGLADLSSRTPFVRMWTSFDLANDIKVKVLSTEEVKDWNKSSNLKDHPDQFLIEKSGGITELHEWEKVGKYKKIYEIGNNVLNTLERGPNVSITGDIDYKNKEGSSRTIEASTVKAVLPNEQETDNNKFLKPPAGITGLTSSTEGPLGTIKKTTVNFIVHNFSDFENIYLRYFLKPGAQIFVDFGWDTAQLYNIENLLSVDDIEDKLYGETGYVTKSNGDLETLYGHVINYDAKIREDGGFDCSVEIISKNAALLSNAFDPALKERVKYGLDIEALGLAVSGVLGDPEIYYKATKWNNDSETEEELRDTLEVAAAKLLGGRRKGLPGSKDSLASLLALEYGVFYAGTADNNMRLFINFGWFEDKFLNGQFGFSDNIDSLINATKDSAKIDEASLKAKFNSRNSFATFSSGLKNIMTNRSVFDKIDFLYPASWGSNGKTYNINNQMIPDRFFDEGTKDERPRDMGEWTTTTEAAYKEEEEKDIKKNRIPLRELFLSIDTIKESMDSATSSAEFFKNIMERVKKSSGEIIDMGLRSNNYGQNIISFMDKNQLSIVDKEPVSPGELSEFMKKLLVFKPYSPNTIVKGYDLSFEMPKGGLGNILAIQASSKIGSTQSINNILDGFVKHEELNRIKENHPDIFIRYNPSIGKESGNRFIKNYQGNNFNLSKNDVIYNETNTLKRISSFTFDDTIKDGDGVSAKDFIDVINENLDRALNTDLELDGTLVIPKEKREKSAEDTKKSEAKIARDGGYKLAANPYDYWIKTSMDSFVERTSPLIELYASLKIYGISGFVPGDLIRINYLPKNYLNSVYWQVITIEQEIGSTWDTSLTLQMRIAPISNTTSEKEKVHENSFRVGKSYLRNVLKLKDIDKYISAFGNLKPILLDSEYGEYPYIEHKFLCKIEDTIENDTELPRLETVFKEDPLIDSLKKLLGGEKWWGKDSIGKEHKNKSWGIKAEFDNYVTPWGTATGAIVFSIISAKENSNGFQKEAEDNKFFLYTSGINWLIFPVAVKIDINHTNEFIINEVFMFTENNPYSGKQLTHIGEGTTVPASSEVDKAAAAATQDKINKKAEKEGILVPYYSRTVVVDPNTGLIEKQH